MASRALCNPVNDLRVNDLRVYGLRVYGLRGGSSEFAEFAEFPCKKFSWSVYCNSFQCRLGNTAETFNPKQLFIHLLVFLRLMGH